MSCCVAVKQAGGQRGVKGAAAIGGRVCTKGSASERIGCCSAAILRDIVGNHAIIERASQCSAAGGNCLIFDQPATGESIRTGAAAVEGKIVGQGAADQRAESRPAAIGG